MFLPRDAGDLHADVRLAVAAELLHVLATAEELRNHFDRRETDDFAGHFGPGKHRLADLGGAFTTDQQHVGEFEGIALSAFAVINIDRLAFLNAVLVGAIFKDRVHTLFQRLPEIM